MRTTLDGSVRSSYRKISGAPKRTHTLTNREGKHRVHVEVCIVLHCVLLDSVNTIRLLLRSELCICAVRNTCVDKGIGRNWICATGQYPALWINPFVVNRDICTTHLVLIFICDNSRCTGRLQVDCGRAWFTWSILEGSDSGFEFKLVTRLWIFVRPTLQLGQKF